MAELFHVSHDSGIERFEPRPPPSANVGVTEDTVWAIEGARLMNYFLPRDCPRVTFYPVGTSTEEDIERLMSPGSRKHVVAIETGWLERVLQAEIWIYSLPPETFQCVDAGAGYWVSKVGVIPLSKRKVNNSLLEMVSMGGELRVLPNLWPLCDEVVESSLQFSCIRMRNATPREAGC